MDLLRTVLVVIDAQRAFVDPAGSLARAFGMTDLAPSVEALSRLGTHLAIRPVSASVIWVRSEYEPGQFTRGRLDVPMAELCVPGRNVDCEWAPGVRPDQSHHVVTKHQTDAFGSSVFRALLDQQFVEGVGQVVFAGFQFTTCVVESALSTAEAVRGQGIRVSVSQQLSGARASSYAAGQSGLSRVEAARRRLVASGVDLVEHAV